MSVITILTLLYGSIFTSIIVVYFITSIEPNIIRRTKMDYGKLLDKVMEATGTVLGCVLYVLYAISSLCIFISTMFLRRLGNKTVSYEAQLDLFGYIIKISSGEKDGI